MIKKGSKSIASIMKGSKVIKLIYKCSVIVYESVRYVVINGIFPLFLKKSVGEELKDYKIYGNSVQDGIPTSDTPVEIESVGEKTSNLADLSKATVSATTYYTTYDYDITKGMLELTSSPMQFDYTSISAVNLGLEVGKTYYYGGDITVSGKTTNKDTVVILTLGTNSGINQTFKANGTRHIQGVFTYTGQASVSLRLFFNYGSAEPARVRFDNLYVSEIKDEFEPYGYKIPINLSNGNDEKTTNIYLSEPLRKAGEYADYIDFANSKIVRWIKHEFITSVLNASSIFGKYKIFLSEISEKPRFDFTYTNLGQIKCNKFSMATIEYAEMVNNKNVMQSYITNAGDYRVAYTFDETVTTVEEAQVKIGDGFDVCYVTDKAVEEVIQLPTISTYQGTTILDSDVNIKPSNVEVVYKRG